MTHPDHDHHFDDETGPWPMGWAIAILASILAVVLVVAIGGATGAAGLLTGLVTFGVFGVLLGSGGVERAAQDGHDPHTHGGGHH
jgi:hypothetical protein